MSESKIEFLAACIASLTVRELRELNEIIERGGGEALGVREPRSPGPESPGDSIAKELPEDYWESAQ